MEKPEMNAQEKLRILLIRCGQKLNHHHGGHQTQGRILKILYYQGPMSQKLLQEKLDIQPGSMSEIAAKLERKGLLSREKDTSDKRKILLSLTEAGRQDVEAFQARVRNSHFPDFSPLTIEEQQQLSRLLEKLLSGWSDSQETAQ
ncbi:MAG: MarR family transcriptional regulator [Eubacteriales bacterium]|nr:MarR family transcriptional regulator [Eubacteriales bacterium]